jgi:hypothetical protein
MLAAHSESLSLPEVRCVAKVTVVIGSNYVT